MLRNRKKGQAMTEFALILPLLLLLLLGIVEAARTIWAFITVQQAAREAARYAVTGRPYLDVNTALSGQTSTCTGVDPEPDPFQTNTAPWACENDKTKALIGNPADSDAILWNPRVDAIKRVAVSIGQSLAVSDVCFTPEQYYGTDPAKCNQLPGAFGVLIQGQVTTRTTTGTLVIYPQPVEDHAGYQGLNVQVNTFYNLQMITPIFDALMGGTFIRLQGRVQLQNEGLDEAAGIEPPPGLPAPGVGGLNPGDPTGGSSATINAQNPTLPEFGTLRVDLINYDPAKHYNVYLELGGTLYKICSNVGIPVSGTATGVSCSLGSVPVGPDFLTSVPVPVANGYTLFSAEYDTQNLSTVPYGDVVNVIAASDPIIAVNDVTPPDFTIWAANDVMPVKLLFHDDTTNYIVKLFSPDKLSEWEITPSHSGADTNPIDWTVPNIGTICEAVFNGPVCIINSFNTADPSTPVATTTVQINIPVVVMSLPSDKVTNAYVRGEVVDIFLRKHTPLRSYSMQIPTGVASGITSLPTDQAGDTTQKITWVIPNDCGGSTGFADGIYQISSHSTHNSNLGALIGLSANFEVKTPTDPTVTVDGGTTWIAGNTIKIRVLRHTPNASHYLEFDGVRIPTGALNDTFITDNCGTAQVDFTIPPTTTEGPHIIASYDSNGNFQDDVEINVLTKPFIHVLEGDVVMPGQTITIEGVSHKPNESYAVFYADKFLQAVLADGNGSFIFPYNLTNLPITPGPDLTNFNNLGIPYILKSQTVAPPITDVATTTLTIQGADLVVTQVKVASVAPYSTTIPVDIVVQNVLPVTINQFVDVDLYNLQIPNPNPFGPSYLDGYNFPGDVKFWKNTIAPNEVFTFSHQLSLDELGLKTIYGYADVSNNVFEGEQAGQVANPNNINSAPLLVNCPASLTTDSFDNGALPGWTSTGYGDGNGSTSANGTLSLTSDGSTTWVSNDNNGGELLLHQSGTFSSASGLDVQVMLSHVDVTGMGTWAKAGIEIRDSLNPDSPRVTWGVARNNGSNTQPRQVLQAGYRDTGNTMDWVGGQTFWLTNHAIDLDLPAPVPVWLRISREPGTNGIFNFYYKQSATPPPALNDDQAQQTYWQGALVESVSVSGIGDNVVVGLFNSSYLSGTAGTSNFDNFSVAVADPALCQTSTLGPPLTFPPLYETCTQVLQNTSFEIIPITGVWKTPDVFNDVTSIQTRGGVSTELSDGNIGTKSLKAETLVGGTVKTPHFHQQFTMPDWVISSTTRFDLDLYRKIDTQGSPDPNDKFYAAVVTNPSDPYNSSLTNPVEVAVGNFSNWNQKKVTFQTKAGVNLENYKNQNLALYFYNDSNTLPANDCNGSFCSTTFKFDDINLNVCTKEPPPSQVQTRIKGQLTLNYSNGTSEALPFVKVWAYAQGVSQGVAPVYETFTIQNGEFNFYNLPTGTYTIFAQYNLVQGTQIETLSADTKVLLESFNNDATPAMAFLNLFTLGPLP